MQVIDYRSLGLGKPTIRSGPSALPPRGKGWFAIQALTACVLDDMKLHHDVTPTNTYMAVPLPAGSVLLQVKTATLNSGTAVIMYGK